MRMKILLIGICALVCALMGMTATATTWTVDGDGGTDFVKIPRAIGTDGDMALAYSWSCAEKTTTVPVVAIEEYAAQGSVDIDSDTIDVNIKLSDTPSILVFDQDFAPDNILEYEWSIYIDLDNNPSTGSTCPIIEGCEVSISLMNFNFPDSTQHTDTIIGGTQHNTWIFNESEECWCYGHTIDATVDYPTNTIKMTASKGLGELSGVDETDRFCFIASYLYAAYETSEDMTSFSGGSNVVTDPEGDVSYSFVDILQGSLDASSTSKPVHNPDTGEDFSTIHAAIDDSDTQDGHTITVDAGTYNERIVINKAISLIGENKNDTVIDGNGNEVVSIYSNNVEVSNFTLQNGDGGITAMNSADGKIFNNIIRYNTGGIGLETSRNFMIFDNYVYNNSQAGIGVWDGSYDSVIYNNTIIQNGYEGIGVGETSYNITIFDNYVFNNTNTGIGLWDTSNLTVVYNNTLINNSNANIAIGSSSFSNIIYHNNFLSDFTNALDYNGSNTWDNGYPSGGNYWSDYTGTDANSDGIGDTPYNIDGGTGAQDKYPLMQPWNGSSSVTTPPEDHATLSISYTLSNLSSVNWTKLSSEYNASIGTNYARFEITHMLPDLVNIRCAKPGSKYFAILDENTTTYTIRVEGNSSELLRAVLPRASSYIYTDDCLDGSCTKWGFEIGKTKSNMLNLTAFSTIEHLKDIGILSSGDLTGMPVFRTSLINPGEKIFLFGYGMSGSGASPSTPTDSWSWNIPSPASYGDYTNSFGFVTDNMRYQYLLGHVGGDNSNNGVITINGSEWLRHNNWYDSDRHGSFDHTTLSSTLSIHWTWSSVWTSLWQASIGSSFNVTEVPYGNYYNSSITPVRDEILKIIVVNQSVLPIRSEIIDDSTLPDMSHSDITGGNILNNTYTAPPSEHFYKLYLRPWSSSGKGVAVRVDGLRSDNQKWEIIENYVTPGDFIIDDYDFFESDQKTYDQIKIYVDESESWGTAHYEYKLWHGQYKDGAKVTVYEHGLNNIVSEKITNSEGSVISGLDPSKTYDVAVNGIICGTDVSVPDIISTTVGAAQKGDLNSDGSITAADAAIALEIAAGSSTSCDPATLAAADVSGDGHVTSLDALMILQAAAGKIEL